MKAIWNGEIIAESNETIMIEDNHYFPKESLNLDYLKHSSTQTVCHWKGIASYFSLNVNGNVNKDAAWFYPEPKSAAQEIKDICAYISPEKGGEGAARDVISKALKLQDNWQV